MPENPSRGRTPNRILSHLTRDDFALLEPHLAPVDLPVRKRTRGSEEAHRSSLFHRSWVCLRGGKRITALPSVNGTCGSAKKITPITKSIQVSCDSANVGRRGFRLRSLASRHGMLTLIEITSRTPMRQSRSSGSENREQ